MRQRGVRQTIVVATAVVTGLIGAGCGSSSKLAPAAQLTTRQRTVRPVAVTAPPIAPNDVAAYATNGYSAWVDGPGEDEGRKLDLMPAGYAVSPNAGQLASFFTMSDIHITDKESPAQVPYFGWSAAFGSGGLAVSAWSPVELSTTQVLDAAVRTVNALHALSPLDFGVVLGDVANGAQYNEVRWFIDVMDGKPITPSSGAHDGASTIDYQRPFQAAGLNPAIPWYATVGNHDHFWMGVEYPTAKIQAAAVGDTVLNIGAHLLVPDNTSQTGVYCGVIDGATPLGNVVKGGPEADFATPPTVVADANRRLLSPTGASVANLLAEFDVSTSLPAGHGFHGSSPEGCYVFRPVANVPLRVMVLNDTCLTTEVGRGSAYYGSGWVDRERFEWLTRQLGAGQDVGDLMIVATHVPINPRRSQADTAPHPQFHASSYKSDAELIATLHNYPNLILLLAGHRHVNTVTPHPSPDAAHPERGFWEVETPSLRDFPQQFRTFAIQRNVDQTISIVTTDVDPIVEAGSPAAKSRGYAIGAHRVFGYSALSDTSSHTYNAELVKLLTPDMQARIAACGAPRAAATR